METKQKIKLLLFAMLGSFLMVATSEAAPHQLTCGGRRTIHDALRHLRPGATFFVSGTCNENVVIPEEIHNVTLDGQGTASINGPDASSNTITVRGNGITIRQKLRFHYRYQESHYPGYVHSSGE